MEKRPSLTWQAGSVSQIPARALSFGSAADIYRAVRPGYPEDAVRWAVPPGARHVVDLAAGTGKLTQVLHRIGVAEGFEVVAVEPDAGMRAALSADLPTVTVRDGTAERTGLPDGSADAVTVGTAWHWFDAPAAAGEIARVLRPGGTLTVLWNVRDETTDWVARYSEILHRGDDRPTERATPELGPAFGPVEHAEVRWGDRLRTADLRALAASRSHVIVQPQDVRDELLAAVDGLVATHPDLRGRESVEVPYRTECWRAVRLPAPTA